MSMAETRTPSHERVIRIAALCGSLRPGSYTRAALKLALDSAAGAQVETELIDLRGYTLAFQDGVRETARPPDVTRLSEALRSADGILIGTPEYHGSFSGVLKNALDWMGFEEFEGKMVGLLGVSGGVMGAHEALNGLRTIGRSLHAWVVPEQVSIAEAWKVFEDDGRMKDGDVEERIRRLGRQVARFARLHKCEAALEFLENWEKAPVNPGGA